MSEDVGRLPLTPLSMAILLALADGERHGYALMQDIEAQTDGLDSRMSLPTTTVFASRNSAVAFPIL